MTIVDKTVLYSELKKQFYTAWIEEDAGYYEVFFCMGDTKEYMSLKGRATYKVELRSANTKKI